MKKIKKYLIITILSLVFWAICFMLVFSDFILDPELINSIRFYGARISVAIVLIALSIMFLFRKKLNWSEEI